MDNDKLVQLDPSDILMDDNSRFSLLPHRLAHLKENILAVGGIQTPVVVEKLPKEQDGYKYRLTAGFYRVTSALQLNEEGAGISIPALVREPLSAAERLKQQLSENVDRENLSPMDQATAIKRLIESGVSKMDVRKIFSRPGGRKGLAMQPASNAYVNMTLSFLELPKAIQQKIHDGRVTVGAAYEITKAPIDKREAVLKKAEEARAAEFEREENEEKKFLDSERKATEAAEKTAKLEEEAAAVKAAAAEATKLVEEKLKAESDLFHAARKQGLDKKAKELATEKFKGAENERKAAQKLADDKAKEAKKLEEKLAENAKKAEEAAAKLAAARAAKKADPKKGKTGAVGARHVKKAAGQTPGADKNGPVALNASEMRKGFDELRRPGAYPNVALIAEEIFKFINGVSTHAQLYTGLAKITGEHTAKKGAKA